MNGSTAFYRVCGKFDGACAWDLSARLQGDPLCEAVVDFSRANEFVDYAVGVMASALLTAHKRVQLRGLRRHQERLFRYFGVDLSKPTSAEEPAPRALPRAQGTAEEEVA